MTGPQLPFALLPLRPPSREDAETDDDFETMQVWIADIQDVRRIKSLIDWSENNGTDLTSLAHLRSVRKTVDAQSGETKITLLVAPAALDAAPPTLPLPLPEGLSPVYTAEVPSYPARTKAQLKAKNAVWPSIYAPKRPSEAEEHVWTSDEVEWVRECLSKTVQEAVEAQSGGDVGTASHVSLFQASPPVNFTGRDTRQSSRHPLHHSVMNVIRRVADHLSSTGTQERSSVLVSVASPAPHQAPSEPGTGVSTPTLPNATVDYLLTGLTLFTTHEPCIMCSMALVHSRVSRIFFIHSMSRTGGCGGCTAITGLNGVNHRYEVYKWDEAIDDIGAGALVVEGTVDA